MRISSLAPRPKPPQTRPLEWKQVLADGLTIGAASWTGATLGPLPGGFAGAGVGQWSQRRLQEELSLVPLEVSRMRQTQVGLAAGLTAGLAMSAAEWSGQALSPLLGAGLGVVVGAAAATWLPHRVQTPLKDHWNNLETLQAPQLWAQGLTGRGVGVAVLDTGLEPHPALPHQPKAFQDLISGKSEAYDGNSHGTSMAGIIAGQGHRHRYPGVAPEADIIALKVANDQGKVDVQKAKEAIDWCCQHRQEHNLQVINLSFSADPDDDPQQLLALDQSIAKASEQGLIVVASAGNDGPQPAPLPSPARAPQALACASFEVDSGLISDFSHRSPPGQAGALVATPGSLWLEAEIGSSYGLGSGTSQAAAALSGLMALWKQARPDLTSQEARQALLAQPGVLEQTPLARGVQGLQSLGGGVQASPNG